MIESLVLLAVVLELCLLCILKQCNNELAIGGGNRCPPSYFYFLYITIHGELNGYILDLL